MHINEVILREMASKKLFHYTNVQSALAILKNQEFRLTVAVGADSEVNSGYHYYLSTSRNKVNDYTRSVSDNGVMFNLNGDFFNRHYKVKPIDYWGRDMWLSSHKTKQPNEEYFTSEQEDRVLSNKPTIKFNGKATEAIESVHVLLTSAEFVNENQRSSTRKVIIAAKQLGIPTYFYDNTNDFKLQHSGNTVKPIIPDKAESSTYYSGNYGKRYLKPWVELYYKNNDNDLSKEGKDLAYTVSSGYLYTGEDDFGLNADIHNSRTPTSSGRDYVEKIIGIMHKEGLAEPRDYALAMRNKWRSIYGLNNETR